MNRYSINLNWSDEDQSYVATVPEFPNLMAFGDTPDEALKEANVALEGFIKIFEEDGLVLPNPIKTSHYSGKISLRILSDLHMELSNEAKIENCSLNQYISFLLIDRHRLKQFSDKFKNFNQNIYQIYTGDTESVADGKEKFRNGLTGQENESNTIKIGSVND